MIKKLFGSLLLAFLISLSVGFAYRSRSTVPEGSIAMPYAILTLLPLTILFFTGSLLWPRIKNKKKVLSVTGISVGAIVLSVIGIKIWLKYHSPVIDDNMTVECVQAVQDEPLNALCDRI